jgi:hypothetical protein
VEIFVIAMLFTAGSMDVANDAGDLGQNVTTVDNEMPFDLGVFAVDVRIVEFA